MFSDNIFNGVISKTMRKFIADNINTSVPFSDCTAGTFAVAGAAASVGCKKIVCSDIGLYSCVVGYYIQKRDIAEFDIRFDGSDRITNHAEALFYFWISKLKNKIYYEQYLYKNILFQKDHYIDEINNSLENIAKGFKDTDFFFEYCDLNDVIKNFKEGTMFIDPPSSKKNDYIPGSKLSWVQPYKVDQTPFSVLNDLYIGSLRSSNNFIIRRFRTVKECEKEFVCYVEGKNGKNDYLLSNFIANKKYLDIGKQKDVIKTKFKLVTNPLEINENSDFNFKVISREQGLYYRDLFCKGLGQTDAEVFIGWFIGEQLLGVSGFHCSDWIVKNADFIFEIFGFSIRLTDDFNLNKLHMLMLSSVSLRDTIVNYYKNASIQKPAIFRTVCLSKYYEQKGNRGVLKLKGREKMNNGLFKLVYETEFRTQTLKEIYKKWSSGNVNKK